MKMMVNRRLGFTMIELMIAVAILATLAAIMTPRFVRARYNAYLSACMANERNLATALEAYRVGNSVYPAVLGTLVTDGELSKLPLCPSAPGSGVYDYEIASDFKDFTVSCKTGFHEFQLPLVVDGYPQYVNGMGVRENP